jgi:hypothetical protein
MLAVLKVRTSSLSFTIGEVEMRVTGHCLAWAAIAKEGVTNV